MLNILNLLEIYFKDASSWKYPNKFFQIQKFTRLIKSSNTTDTVNQTANTILCPCSFLIHAEWQIYYITMVLNRCSFSSIPRHITKCIMW